MIVLFAALWVPAGQQAFLAEHWMKIGTFAAPVLVFMGFTNRAPDAGPVLADVKLMATLMTAAYMVHQFEEHWIDALGRIYPLRELLNEMLRNAFGPAAAAAMSPEAIFFINTSVVWLIGFIAIWRAPSHVFPALAMGGVVFVNGLSHLALAAASGSYNPGLVTSVVLFLPLSVIFGQALLARQIARAREVVLGICWGIGAHVFLVAGVLAANVHGLIPISVFYAAIIGWAIVPALAFNPSRTRQA